MSFIMQIIFGVYIGAMVSGPTKSRFLDIGSAILGVSLSNAFLNSFGIPGVVEYSLYSFVVALCGAVPAVLFTRSLMNSHENRFNKLS